jgi:GTP-binding protein LepA
MERTRNFCIIAHIDHGKSTLSDRLLEISKNIPKLKKGEAQVLDSLDVERQRGITVKAQTASMLYTSPHDNQQYLLNLVDTPGHVDFSHEVSRSLAACQGALLLVDCAQGVEAQTVANYHAALDAGLAIVPVLTKIDLPTADPEPVLEALEAAFGIPPDDVIWTSAKSGVGCAEVFPAVVHRLGPPLSAGREAPVRALLVDSWFDSFRGVVCLVQVVDGSLHAGDRLTMAHSGESYTAQEFGLMTPRKRQVASVAGAGSRARSVACLAAGQVGYVILGMKSTKQAPVGDTLLGQDAVIAAGGDRVAAALLGFKPAKPMVFASLFPVDMAQFESLQTAVERLTLNDASVTVQRESSPALGFGLRCGFLGLLHMDVFHQRLQDEFDTPVIATAPMVPYKLKLKTGENIEVEKAGDFPSSHTVAEYQEPIVRARVIVPEDKLSPVMSLLFERRGTQVDMTYMGGEAGSHEGGGSRVVLTYDLPWAGVVTDFFDVLKSVSAGYATFDYEPAGYRAADIARVDLMINKAPVDALSFVAVKENAEAEGRAVAAKLRSLIKRQQFEVVIQAAIGAKVIARERIAPYRKDVLNKSGKTVGGGDQTRKQKLLSKQKKGKARMKTVGNVSLSQEAFMSLMSRGSS